MNIKEKVFLLCVDVASLVFPKTYLPVNVSAFLRN